MEAGGFTAPGGRSVLKRSSGARLRDVILQWGVTLLSVAILLLIAYFFLKLIDESTTVFDRFGVFGFTFDNDWDVSKSVYGALPLVVGTLITSTIALAMGVPVAVATALYITELCPRRFRSPLTIVVELLAAVPSVVYGLWAFIVIVPFLKPAEQWFADTFSFIPFVGGHVAAPNYFIAGLVLAIMILPIVSAITGEAASNPLHRSALIAAGLVLFVLTLFVNLIARFYVLRAERGGRVTRTVVPGMGE